MSKVVQEKTIPAKIVVDLAPLGGEAAQEIDGEFLPDSFGRPEFLRTTLPHNLDIKVFELVFNTASLIGSDQICNGTLASGENFTCEIGEAKTLQPGTGAITGVFFISNFQSTTSDKKEPALWHLKIANYRPFRSDVAAAIPLSDNQAIAPNGIKFSVADRDWLITDRLFAKKDNELTSISDPIVTGDLWTEFKEGDTREAIEEIAFDICKLLSLGSAREVAWTQVTSMDKDRTVIESRYFRPLIFPFKSSAVRLADNWERENIKQLLEESFPAFTQMRDWWHTTIAILIQARGSQSLQCKCSLLNTLLDRVTTKINEGQYGNEIDEKIPKRLKDKEFQKELHAVLIKLTDKWEVFRTESVCNQIKRWNDAPNFPNQIKMACAAMQVECMPGKYLNARHQLVHAGELDKKFKTGEQQLEYLDLLTGIVQLLIVRMLSFTGFVMLRSHGLMHQRVETLLVKSEES